MAGNTIWVQTDIFSFTPINVLKKPSIFNPFRDWEVEVNGKVYRFPWKYSKDDVISALEKKGVINRGHFIVYEFCGFKVLTSKKEGTYLFSPYTKSTYFLTNEFVPYKTQVAEVVLNNLHNIFDPKERDRIYLCAKKALKHPTELNLVLAS
jgi:hypothetical protein